MWLSSPCQRDACWVHEDTCWSEETSRDISVFRPDVFLSAVRGRREPSNTWKLSVVKTLDCQVTWPSSTNAVVLGRFSTCQSNSSSWRPDDSRGVCVNKGLNNAKVSGVRQRSLSSSSSSSSPFCLSFLLFYYFITESSVSGLVLEVSFKQHLFLND